MGIPFFFKTIVSGFPHVIQGRKQAHVPNCDQLYLDYNCVMHMCAAKLLQSVSSESTTPQEFMDMVMTESLKYIDEIMKYSLPAKLLFVAIDGVCPRAKMHQQRKRRYLSIWRNSELEKQGVMLNRLWDSNMITPGTTFMKTFDQFIAQYQQQLLTKVPTSCNVIVSPSSEFGEGEHKMFNHIKENKTIGHTVIYGLDADLILLSMLSSTAEHRIGLMRETPEFGIKLSESPFLQLDVEMLRNSIIQYYFQEFVEMNTQLLIRDYVMLCTLIGNDFLPPLSYLKIKFNGIENIINAYKAVMRLVKRPLCPESGLDLMILSQIISELMRNEDEYVSEVSKSYYERKAFAPQFKTRKDMVEWKIDNYPTLHKYPQVIDTSSKGWRLAYYRHLFGDHSPSLINQVCMNYIDGLHWVFEYYFTCKQNNGWYYKYNYSPSILDVHRCMSTMESGNHDYQMSYCNTHETHREFNQIICPELHLMMVLPPQSIHLMDEKHKHLVNDIDSGLLHYFPHSFTISTYLKQYLWECSISLPDIDIATMARAHRAITV